jgi:formylglycine-generating enzyme required for sulfatase activity
VRIEPFLLARTELSEAQWLRMQHGTAAGAGAGTLPATGMNWDLAVEMLRRRGMQLPTEAQWEYACRAGSRKPWAFAEAEAEGHAWLDAALHPVGTLAPNAFGLFDMHGNAAEWCRDAKVSYLQQARPGDGLREAGDGMRVLRGGSTQGTLVAARSSARAALPASASDRSIGIRPARQLRGK